MKKQNRSNAVMATRIEPKTEPDFFPTPPWATRALCEILRNDFYHATKVKTVWEPACGKGDMSMPLGEYFGHVLSSDLIDYGFGGVRDFLGEEVLPECSPDIDWIITNPPFSLAQEFTEKAFKIAKEGVAMFVRLQWLEGQTRVETLFKSYPPTSVHVFAERVVLHKNRLSRKGSTATAYCWVIWDRRKMHMQNEDKTELKWITDARDRLIKESDYAGYDQDA